MGKILPRNFSGEIDSAGKAEDPSVWLDHYELVSTINGWESDKARLQGVAINFTGEAEDWHSVNRTWINTEDRKWMEFRAKFIERF